MLETRFIVFLLNNYVYSQVRSYAIITKIIDLPTRLTHPYSVFANGTFRERFRVNKLLFCKQRYLVFLLYTDVVYAALTLVTII